MDSDKSDEDEHETISKQIVEYYKKYSLSQQLPKYFSGTPLSYMPKIVKDEEINKPLIIIEDTSGPSLLPKQSEYCQTDVEEAVEPKTVSPASSVTSTRKLEWDSGADIGYNNCQKKLQKSSSLPTLTTDHKVKAKPTKSKLSSHIVNVVSYSSSTSDHKVAKAQSSSSSSSYHPEAVVVASSSSSSSAKPPSAKVLSSSSSSSARAPSVKPLSSSSSSFTNTLAYLKTKIGSPDAESTPKGTGETPFIPRPYRKMPNKVIALCVTKPISIDCVDGKRKKKALDKRVQTSFVEKLSKSVQTGDETANAKKKGPTENQSIILIHYDSGGEKKTSPSNTQTDSEVVSPPGQLRTQSTDSSKEIPPLGQLISRQQSKSLVADIDKSIELLQKLLKSKKYDAATKKRYVKKIVEKIINNTYTEDSSASSDLFKPKKQEQKLQENIPWYPPKLSKFGVKTFKDEFLPEEEVAKKRSMFTVSEARYTPTSCADTYSSLEKPQDTTSGSFQSWKEEKTLSERLLEQKQKGEGDHLVNFAMKERQNQILWINDEISHLVRLKELLEQNQMHTNTTVYMVSQGSRDSSSDRRRNYVIQTGVSRSGSSSASERHSKRSTLTGNLEFVSDERTTNIKVQTKEVDVVRKPTLVGTGKYDTYPRSKQEERKCWPCGVMQSRKEGCPKYSFDVPLSEDATAIIKKVDEIVNKYGSSRSSVCSKGSAPGCFCCKCQSKVVVKEPSSSCTCTCKCVKTQSQVVKETCDKDVECKIGCKCKKKYSEAYVQVLKETCDKDVECTISCKCKLPPADCVCTCKCKKKDSEAQSQIVKDTCDKDVECTIGCKCKKKDGATHAQVVKETCDKDVECTIGCKCKLPPTACTCTCKCTKKDSSESEKELKKTCDKDVECKIGCECKKPPSRQQDNTTSVDESTETNVEEIQDPKLQHIEENYEDNPSQGGDDDTNVESIESSSTVSSDGSGISSTGSIRCCVCCKRQNVTANHLYDLGQKLNNDSYPLCRPCYRQNQRCAFSYNTYTAPGHVCNCYSMVKTKTLDDIKRTIDDLKDLDYCGCVDVDNGSNSSCCRYCRKKLKDCKNKNGIAYLVTFEKGPPSREERRRMPLEEIKIKIPAVKKKKHKDNENKRRRRRSSTTNGDSRSSGREERKTAAVCSLQQYLVKNRPGFVEIAEERRRSVKDSRSRREEVADENKLKFLQNYRSEKKNSKRLFSEKEMKEITRRNYRKLPEVQQRLKDNKRMQIRQANRLIADTFNRKLKDKVLKGKRTLPTDVNVVNL